MHVNGYPDEQKEGVLADFFSAVCPVAAELAARGRRLAVHWADSFEVRRGEARWGCGPPWPPPSASCCRWRPDVSKGAAHQGVPAPAAAASPQVLRLIPDNGFRLAMPANACP